MTGAPLALDALTTGFRFTMLPLLFAAEGFGAVWGILTVAAKLGHPRAKTRRWAGRLAVGCALALFAAGVVYTIVGAAVGITAH